MKTCSFRDLLKFPQLEGFREIDLINPALDHVVGPCVYALGIDTRQPAEIVANLHRDLDNKAELGYRIVGEQRMDDEYLNSPLCDTIERIIAVGQRDPGLMLDLVEMMNKTVDFKSFHGNEGDVQDYVEFPSELIEPDYQQNVSNISVMNHAVVRVRGTNLVTYQK